MEYAEPIFTVAVGIMVAVVLTLLAYRLIEGDDWWVRRRLAESGGEVDFLGFTFTPEGVIVFVVGFWATGLMLGAVGALLASLVRRR